MGQKTKILLVDDHKVIRDGISSYFVDDEEFVVVGEANNGEAALEWLSGNDTDIVLTDISMGSMNGTEMTEQITKQHPATRVIALTMHDDYHHISSMFKAGAAGYLLKNSGEDEVKEAIRTVVDGEVYQGESIQRTVLDHVMRRDSYLKKIENRTVGDPNLTEREIEVLRLIAEEYSNSEIAEKLFISVRTVDSHKRHIIQKTGAKNSVGLVRYALSKGLIE